MAPVILREVAKVLRQKIGWEEQEILAHLKLISGVAEIVSPAFTLGVFTGPMEPDNRILECAIAGRADLIVSGDRDLQRLKVYQHIPIIRPADAVRTLGSR